MVVNLLLYLNPFEVNRNGIEKKKFKVCGSSQSLTRTTYLWYES